MLLHTTKAALDQLTYEIIGAAIHVHKTLGPGLLESIYHQCLKIELEDRGIEFKTEHAVCVLFNERKLETTLGCDLFIEDKIVVELKAVNQLQPLYEAQLLTYMKLLHAPKGILINFNCVNLFNQGQKTNVNELFRSLPEC
jgi:GxxExxY protein